MKNFMDENFLLQTETAQKLYHEHAAKMPIIDYHCHLIPQMVADDYQFKSLTEIWLGGDHYSSLYLPQPIIPLDSFGIENRIWNQ